MSAGAISVENGCLMNKNNKNNNNKNSYECKNVDIDYILKDINKYRKGKKRSALISDDTSYINDDKLMNKKIKSKNLYTKSEDENDEISSQESLNNYQNFYSEDKQLKNYENVKNKINENKTKNQKSEIDNENTYDNINKKNVSFIVQDYKIISSKIESCVDFILENIKSCNELNEAKKIMILLLSNFIHNNFIYIDDSEADRNVSRNLIENYYKERKILRRAIKWQYNIIMQSQKIIDNQRKELRNKNDELNQIKAKIHQYIYDASNPKQSYTPFIYPDVY